MKQQFKLYRRSNGRYYAEDTTTGKQSSLGTRDKAEAHRLLHAQNEAAYQPAFNKQMAKTYLAAGDPRANTRTWQDVMGYLLQSKEGRSRKTGRLCTLRFGDEVAEILKGLPTRGPLFPKYATLSSADRATRFAERVERLGIRKRSEAAGIPSICLHSYRYSWAERARAAGYPERYAQETLGHQSSSFARFYSKRANVELPPLEQYEKRNAPSAPPPTAPAPNIIPLPAPEKAATATGTTANEPAAQPAQMQEAV